MRFIQFGFEQQLYSVYWAAATLGDTLIELPDHRYVQVIEVAAFEPPKIMRVNEVRLHDKEVTLIQGQNIFEAVLIPEPAYFRNGDCFFKAAVPENASFFDGTLIRMPDGRLVVWGSYEESMTPRMETYLENGDPKIAAAGWHIYDAVPYG